MASSAVYQRMNATITEAYIHFDGVAPRLTCFTFTSPERMNVF